MAKKRRKKKELTIEEQLAIMKPEEIYEKAMKNITVARVLEDIDLKVTSYKKALGFLLYIVEKFDEQTLLYEQDVTKEGRELSESEKQLLAVNEAQRVHDLMEMEMRSETIKLIGSYFGQACSDYEAAKTIDDVRDVRDRFVQIRSWLKKYITKTDDLPAECQKEYQECKKAAKYKKNCDQKLEKLIAAGKLKRNIALVCAVVIAAAAVFFLKNADIYYYRASVEGLIGLTDRAARDYYRSYEQQADEESYTRYLDYVYEAGSKAEDPEEACDYYRRAAEGSYKDSEEKLTETELALLKEAGLGDQVEFGARKWLVVEKSDTECVLVSRKNAVDNFAFSEQGSTWDTSDAREYLNQEFFAEAFNSSEQAAIRQSTVSTEENSEYHTGGGQTTEDKVYLMSADELDVYSEYLGDAKPASWLRTAGAEDGSAAYAWKNTAMLYGYDASADAYGLRPVIRVALP